MKNRVVHFEIEAQDVERAAKFYREVFDWKIEKWPMDDMDYWMVMTADMDNKEQGINGGMYIRKSSYNPKVGEATNAFICTVQVDDIDSVIEKILKAGGTECKPKFMIANMAWQAYYSDTEGNMFGLHQRVSK